VTDNILLVDSWRKVLSGAEPPEILEWAARTFGERVAFATSLGIEDQVLTAMISADRLPISVFKIGRAHV